MAVRPDVPGAGQTGPRPLRRPEPETAADVPVAAPPGATAADAQAVTTPAALESTPGVIPRWLLLLVGAAAATVAVAGLKAIAWLVAPVFLALVVVIALTPVQRWLRRIGAPSWLATAVLLLLVWSVLLSFVALLVLSVAQMAALLPDYTGRAEVLINQVVNDLNDAGIVSGQLSDLVNQIDYSQLVGVATGLLSRFTDAASTLVLLLTALVFVAIESSGFGRRIAQVGAERPHLPVALSLFTQGTRSYLLVSTVFGAIVAVGDWVALSIIGIPAAGIWGLLAFVTNYVPNIGFVVGLVPPAVLGLLEGGWQMMLAVVLVYCVVNLTLQTFIQPRVVGDAVGLSTTITFLSLALWAYLLGPLGALLAVPMSLLAKALLVDRDPGSGWIADLLSATGGGKKEAEPDEPAGPDGPASPVADEVPLRSDA
jgi:AI-2 transport protein TqsA